MNKELEDYFKENNIEYKEHEHPAVFTVEESKRIKLSLSCLHTKSLFLKSAEESPSYYLVCLQADKRLDIKALMKKLNHKKLYFASEEELKSFLNLTPGSVSIFGLINDKESSVSLILDKDIYETESVGFHPNINTSTLVLSNENFIKFYNSLKQDKEIMEL